MCSTVCFSLSMHAIARGHAGPNTPHIATSRSHLATAGNLGLASATAGNLGLASATAGNLGLVPATAGTLVIAPDTVDEL